MQGGLCRQGHCSWYLQPPLRQCVSGLQDDRTADIVPGGFDLEKSGGLVPSSTYLPRRRCAGRALRTPHPAPPLLHACSSNVTPHTIPGTLNCPTST
jgi:hypothetical protein